MRGGALCHSARCIGQRKGLDTFRGPAVSSHVPEGTPGTGEKDKGSEYMTYTLTYIYIYNT